MVGRRAKDPTAFTCYLRFLTTMTHLLGKNQHTESQDSNKCCLKTKPRCSYAIRGNIVVSL